MQQYLSPLDLANRQQLVSTDTREYGAYPVIGLGPPPKRKRSSAEPVSEAVKNLLKEGMKTMPRSYKKPMTERGYDKEPRARKSAGSMRRAGGALKRAGGALKIAGGSAALATELVNLIGPHLGAFILDRAGKIFDKLISGAGISGGAAAPKLKKVQHRLRQLLVRGDKTVKEFAQIAAKNHADAVANLFLDPNIFGKRTRDVAGKKATDHIANMSALATRMTDSMVSGLETIVALLADGNADGAFIDELADRLRTELERVVELREFVSLAHEDKMQDYHDRKSTERATRAAEYRHRRKEEKTPTRSKRTVSEKQKQALAAGRAKRAAMRAKQE